MSRRLILASRSPRRRELLTEYGYSFEIIPARFDEPSPEDGEPSGEYALRLARGKARDVAGRLGDGVEGAVILAADTVVDLAGSIIGQPADDDEARAILARLSGARHAVVTGVVLMDAASGESVAESVRTELEMASVTPEQIDEYVSSGESDGKAGAYAIQETGDRYVRIVGGSRTNVVGLPMELLDSMMQRFAPELAQQPRSDENASPLGTS